MRYFQKFPRIPYTTTEILDGVPRRMNRLVPNMTVTLQLSQARESLLAHEWYRIQDRDRPDTLAAQWYGSSEYAWVILLSNRMRDWYDWPLTNPEFYAYMSRKYETTEGARDGVAWSQDQVEGVYQRVWKTSDNQRLVVDATAFALLPLAEREIVTYYDMESELNDRKRDIKRLTEESFMTVTRQFDEAMKSTYVP